jgi:hypothetical protein
MPSHNKTTPAKRQNFGCGQNFAYKKPIFQGAEIGLFSINSGI